MHRPATSFVHIVAIIMTAIMILHIRSKYTAVGRKEIVMFFWLYAVIELLAIFLDSGIIPTANVSYPVCYYPALFYVMRLTQLVVVCSDLYWPSGRHILLSSHQWLCWVPICRGWNTSLSMGKSFIHCVSEKSANATVEDKLSKLVLWTSTRGCGFGCVVEARFYSMLRNYGPLEHS